MTVLKKVFLLTIIITFFSFSFCYAIDENQLTSNMNSSITATQSEEESISEEATSQTEDTNVTTSTETSISSQDLLSSSNYETQPSTTVSSVSSGTKTSTITNILNIALLVVGVLLIFLAIAILIRLHS